MLERLYKYPGVLEHHRRGPMLEARERYLAHRADEGAAQATLRRLARELLGIAAEIDLTVDRAIGLDEIEAAATRWARRQQRRHRAHGLRWSRELFILATSQWLRFLGRLRESEIHRFPFLEFTTDFAASMRSDRGLSPTTIRNQCWHVAQFLDFFTRCHRPFAEVLVTDVDAFLASKGRQGWNRVSVATSAKVLRAFFRHAESRGWCAAGIAAAIDSPRLFTQEGLPGGPAWEDVERLVASTQSDQPNDIRDRAILMLLAVYGLRSGEVRQLRLEDFNWENEIVSVSRPKQRCVQPYPLVWNVGEAILRYLKEVRPPCRHRELFLTLKAPFRPLSPGALYHLTRTRLSGLAIRSPRQGPHALRHACAIHLVAQGLSLKEVGDHLGHRSAYATRVYAKVDLAGLREVARFDLGGLS